MSNLKQEKEIGIEEEISRLNITGLLIQNQLTIANTLNKYFSTTAEEIMGINNIDTQLKVSPPRRRYFVQGDWACVPLGP